MKRFRKIIKIIAVVFFAFVILFAIFPLAQERSLHEANADSLDVYPGECLGGWQSPGNATGAPDVQNGSGAFTADNSAVLDGTQAQIYCASFQGSDQSQTPTAVTLHFSWNVIFPGQSSAATDTDESLWSSVLDSTSTATTTPTATTTAATTTPTSPAASSTSMAPAPAATNATTTITNSTTPPPAPPAPSSTASVTTPVSTSTNTSTSASAPTPPPTPTSSPAEPSSTPASSTSLLESAIKNSLSLLAPKAFADDATPGDAFMDVSYSLDGVTWTDLGQVSESNWQDYSVVIPVSSWSDINNLQIQLDPIITADPPTVYLDSMWLEVDYNQTLLGDLQDGASTTLGILGDIGNAITSAITDIIPQNASDTTPVAQTPPPAPPAPPPSPPAHRYAFQAQSATAIAVRDLPWIPAGQLKDYDASVTAVSAAAMPTVTVVDNNSLRVAGTCSEAEYVVLLFAHAGDFAADPAKALFNEAQPCVNGSFVRTISDSEFPTQLATGTYYLVIANQGADGTWLPFPQTYPIVIGDAASST